MTRRCLMARSKGTVAALWLPYTNLTGKRAEVFVCEVDTLEGSLSLQDCPYCKSHTWVVRYPQKQAKCYSCDRVQEPEDTLSKVNVAAHGLQLIQGGKSYGET
jgi:transposase-like protein